MLGNMWALITITKSLELHYGQAEVNLSAARAGSQCEGPAKIMPTTRSVGQLRLPKRTVALAEAVSSACRGGGLRLPKRRLPKRRLALAEAEAELLLALWRPLCLRVKARGIRLQPRPRLQGDCVVGGERAMCKHMPLNRVVFGVRTRVGVRVAECMYQ